MCNFTSFTHEYGIYTNWSLLLLQTAATFVETYVTYEDQLKKDDPGMFFAQSGVS